MFITEKNNNIVLYNAENFDIALTLDCGQAFRWKQNENGVWSGVAYGKYLEIFQNGDEITFLNTSKDDFENIWKKYFDLDRNYSEIISSYTDESLKKACEAYPGIRILHQEPWEAVCSFIISANNNIPRIKGIVERLCENFGEKTGESYSFPSPEVLENLTAEDLAPIRSGFRAKYIIDAAKKFASGDVCAERIEKMTFDEAKAELLKIKGVGEKVAQCSLLYGFARMEAFPVDVWVKRIVSELYPDGLPECMKGSEGIAQQYLFHWRRNLENEDSVR